MAKKRGKLPTTEICTALETLLASPPQKTSYLPWRVEINGLVVFVYGKTSQDALRKAAYHVGKVRPVSVQEILDAVKPK